MPHAMSDHKTLYNQILTTLQEEGKYHCPHSTAGKTETITRLKITSRSHIKTVVSAGRGRERLKTSTEQLYSGQRLNKLYQCDSTMLHRWEGNSVSWPLLIHHSKGATQVRSGGRCVGCQWTDTRHTCFPQALQLPAEDNDFRLLPSVI